MSLSLPPIEPEAYLAAIIASSDDAIISKDLNGNITSWNAAAERIFGYTAAEAVGRHISFIIPPDRFGEEDYIIGQVRQGNRVDHFETVRRAKDGRMLTLSVTVSPIKDKNENIIGASKVARDISDRIKADEALRSASIKKDEFLANMSHELRTPMNAVIGVTHLLKGMDLPERARKLVDTLQLSGNNLLDLINDLLDFAKIESGSIELEEIEFSLAEQVEKAISVINVKAQEKNLTLYVNYSANLNNHFIGDPLRIHQCLMNLLSNAVKFTDKGSIEVEVSGAPTEKADVVDVTFKISDTGLGIPKEKLKAIFDKFTQADSSITRRYGGSGLGLAITKAFAEMMGGTIRLDSQVGVGSTFMVTIPLKTTHRQSTIESFSANNIPAAPKNIKNVLLVEDYEPNVMVASCMIEGLGFNYDIAHNGLEAIRMFAHGNYDVILMDVQMPMLDGLEATRRIRRLETEKGIARTPIVAMTAHVKEQDKDKCIEAGMDDFIPKPFNPADLSQKITRYIFLNAEMVSLTGMAKK